MIRIIAITAFSTLLIGAALAQDIHLKVRDVPTDQSSVPTAFASARAARVHTVAGGPVHRIMQFDHAPGVQDLEALLAAGYKVVAMVPDNAVMVVMAERATEALPTVKWIGELEASDKISPALAGQAGQAEVIVEFHPDVQKPVQQAVGAAAGVTLLYPPVLLANHAIANATPEQIRNLAEHDEVAYVFPADPGLLAGDDMMPCAGMLTLAGPIGQYSNIVHGWDLDSGNAAHLGYFFGALTPKLQASTVQTEVLQALTAWSRVTNVDFSPGVSATSPRTILIEFAHGAHGDAYPFDPAGTILAHTFYPIPLNPEPLAGDMHLNADVNWHSGSDIDIYSVALHEAGHAIGLGHTDTPSDVMYPYYRRGIVLSKNDIGAARSLYGIPGSAPATTPVSAPASPAPAAPAKPAALSVTLNAVPAPGQAAQISISGTVAGGVAPVTVDWQTSQGYSGKATAGASGTWTAAGINLIAGANTLTVTAFDSARDTASASEVVDRQQTPPSSASAPMAIHFTSPASAVITQTGSSISLAGTASGGTGVTSVTWQTSGGATGSASGTGPWIAPNVPLLTGANTVIVHAFDAGGDSAWASIVVERN